MMANVITGLRILVSAVLLFCPVFSAIFYVLYLIAGLSDMADGIVARKTNSVSEFGSRFDSIADFVFVAVCLIKILSVMDIPIWLYVWTAVIALIKIINIISGYVMQKRYAALHTTMNKVTGVLLFIVPLTLSIVPLIYTGIPICSVAIFAAVQEGQKYYRSGVFRHFTEDCKCSTSMNARIDVTELVEHSKRTGSKFYINFLYLLSKVLNSRDDYKMGYLWQSEELICYDSINPIQYVFHEDTETCTPVYTTYYEDYEVFYRNAMNDVERAKKTREYGLDMLNHPNWFDASYIPWMSYDSLNVELPDGYLHFAPIINWGKYREENGRLMMPVSVRLNHAIADGFLVANVYRLLEKEMIAFCNDEKKL